jgi:hypothetical protein
VVKGCGPYEITAFSFKAVKGGNRIEDSIKVG